MGFSSTYVTRYMMRDSVRSPRLPDLPQNIHLDLSRSNTQLSKCVIDNPMDDEQKKRERVWEFHQKNRGVMPKTKLQRTPRIDPREWEVNDFSGRNGALDIEYVKHGRHSRRNLPKIRYSRSKVESRNSNHTAESIPYRKDFNNFSPNYTYSSALTIGNSMNSKHQGYEREKYESPSPNGSDRSKKRSISNASERLPEFSAALTKLGYLKLTRNVVHHGGGFFGRHVDKRYADIRRSYSMLENEKRQQEIMQQHYNNNLKDQYGSVQHVNHVDATPLKVIQHSSRPVDGKENEKPLSSSLHLDLSYQKQDESRAKLKPITNDSQRRHDERRRRMEAEVFALDHRPLIIQYDRRSNTSVSPIKREGSEKREKLSQRDSKKNSKQQKSNSHLTPDSDDRPTSNASLDIPLEKFGSSSQLRESRQQKSPWVYGVNPYRWTSKSAVTDDDKPWIERAMQRTEIVDQTTYDGFARTKPVKAQSSD